ncbi:MAG: DMT family transporter [Pseudomonadota bacterium]
MTNDLLPVALGLLSAITLAIVNVAIKRGGDVLIGRAVLSSTSALMIAPFAFVVPAPNAVTWGALAFSLPAHLFYQASLIRSMHRGDLSLVFPIMRGLSPLLTAGTALVFLNEALTPLSLLGLVIATGAVIVFALPPPGVRAHAHPDRTALFWAGMTAVGIALYSAADARGMRLAIDPFTYIVWLFLLDWIGVSAVALASRRGELLAAVRTQWRYGLLAGALSIISFSATLYAFTLTKAAIVMALRETAVVFGALLGWVFLKEGFGRRRTLAAAVLAGGLALMQAAA